MKTVTNFDHSAGVPSDPWSEAAPLETGAPPPDRPPPHRRGWWVLVVVPALALLGFVVGAVLRPWDPGDDRPDPVAQSPGPTKAVAQPTTKAQPTTTTTTQPTTTTAAQTRTTVVYEVTSDGKNDIGSVQYTDQDGDIIRRGGVPLPWRLTFTVTGKKPPLVLISQRKKGGTSPVTCSITFGEKVLTTVTQTGRYASAQCSG